MKVSIATGKFHGFTNDDFAYLQKAAALGESLIIIVGKSDEQKKIITHLGFLKLTEYTLREGENEIPYQNEILKLCGYRDTSPEDNIELIYLENPDEVSEELKLICSQNGVFTLV